MQTIDIGLTNLLVLYLLLVIPLMILWQLRLKIIREIVISIVRMTVQLLFVGIYLKYIFEWNTIWVNGLWVLVMIAVANISVLNKAGLKLKPFFWASLLGISVGTVFMAGVFLFILVKPEPLYDAHYLIPLTGMLLGNCLRGNVLVFERFYSGIQKNETEFLSYLMMGATLKEAVRPYLRDAVNGALAPNIATMTTIGIVSLPGMMTGQILGGSIPLVAIKYQIAIMLGIFISLIVSSVMNIYLSLPAAFNEYDLLREDIFKNR